MTTLTTTPAYFIAPRVGLSDGAGAGAGAGCYQCARRSQVASGRAPGLVGYKKQSELILRYQHGASRANGTLKEA